MRTHTIAQTLYRYDELSPAAQDRALASYAEHSEYPWHGENRDTLDAFERVFPVNIRRWEYGVCSPSFVSFSFEGDSDIEELSGLRLRTYLINNYWHSLYKGLYYSLYGKKNLDGTYRTKGKSRRSRIQFTNDCVLTGYHMDHSILQPVYDFLKKPNPNIDFRDLMEECLDAYASACSRDMEYYFSEESFKDACEANEWEFHENGEWA